MFIKLFLKLNKLFPESKFPHPFNKPKNGIQNLNYSDFEFGKAPEVFQKYNRYIDFLTWIKDKKICDFACGGGGKSVYLATKGALEVYGIDINENFIDQASRIAEEKGVSNKCFFEVQDCANTKLPSDYFDAVILNDTIEHLPNPYEALREANRIIKPGGYIFINFEAYYYFFGHHLWDAIRIPWLHLFTTEKFRIKLYKEAVKSFPDALERINFRISRDHQGIERITYLNRITIHRFKNILKRLLENGLSLEYSRENTFNKKIFQILAKLPLLNEIFTSTIVCVLKKC